MFPPITSEDIRRLGPEIGPQDRGKQLIDYLSGRFLFNSSSVWLEEILKNKILVNNLHATDPNYPLKLGDQVARFHPLSEEPDVDTNVRVIWQMGDVAVISKPPGLTMHESAFFRRKTVHWILPTILGEGWQAAHRLDRETGGLLLCGRTPEMRKRLAQMIEFGQVHKTYLAEVYGTPPLCEWLDRRFIKQPDRPSVPASCSAIGSLGSKIAITKFKLIKSTIFNTSLIRCVPVTGRTHQIRVQLSSVGFPIVGDKLYQSDPSIMQSYVRLGMETRTISLAGSRFHHLHAAELVFESPITNGTVHVLDPILPDWV
jgi:23S rRNA pseudouridine1911/1915/1917 synthase